MFKQRKYKATIINVKNEFHNNADAQVAEIQSYIKLSKYME
jgi:hypothetical protein